VYLLDEAVVLLLFLDRFNALALLVKVLLLVALDG
jgi:hypothetical protein